MFGRKVREARRRLEITQEALAEAAGVSAETVSRIEREALEPSLSTVISIAGAIGLGVESLIGGREIVRPPPPAWPPHVKALANRAALIDRRGQRLLLEIARVLPARKDRGRRRAS